MERLRRLILLVVHLLSASCAVLQSVPVTEAKLRLRTALRESGAEPKSPEVLAAIAELEPLCPPVSQWHQQLVGEWSVISKPDFPDGLGQDAKGRYMFTLGRASFNMFQPLDLPIALDGIVNPVKAMEDGYSYDVCVPFEVASSTSSQTVVTAA